MIVNVVFVVLLLLVAADEVVDVIIVGSRQNLSFSDRVAFVALRCCARAWRFLEE